MPKLAQGARHPSRLRFSATPSGSLRRGRIFFSFIYAFLRFYLDNFFSHSQATEPSGIYSLIPIAVCILLTEGARTRRGQYSSHFMFAYTRT